MSRRSIESVKSEDFDRPDLIEKIHRLEVRIQEEPLNIILWGPGATSSAGFKKREKMREALSALNPRNRVYFPEEISPSSTGSRFGVIEAEAVQAAESDLILVLAATEGPRLEVGLYGFRKNNYEKCIVFAPERFRQEQHFAAIVMAGCRRTIYYDQAAFTDCFLATDTAVQEVNTFRLARKLADS